MEGYGSKTYSPFLEGLQRGVMSLKQEVLNKLDIKNYYSTQLKSFKFNGTALAMGICPFHNDHNPSLSVNLSSGFHKCYACGEEGSIFDFCMKQNKVDFSTALKTLAREAGIPPTSNGKPKDKIVERYDYKDETGKLIFQVLRKEPKKILQRRPDGKNGWIWNLKGIESVLYNLQKVINAHEILIPEGEKDCNRLASLGLIATTCPMGAGKWLSSFNRYLIDKDVVILPDNDDPGRSHALEIAMSLYGTAKSIKIFELPNLPDKGDISDYLDTFKDIEDAKEALAIKIDNCGEWKPEETIIKDTWQFINVSEWLKSDPPPREDLFIDLIPKGIVAGIMALGGTGKTYLILYIILAAITGKEFFKCFKPKKPLKVIALLGEDSQDEIWRRFKAIVNNLDSEINDYFLKENLKLLCGQSEPLMNLNNGNPTTTERYEWLKKQIKEFSPDLVIIDPKAQWYGLEENNNDHSTQWVNALKNLVSINGATILFTHHVTKSSKGELSQLSARGGSALVDACRWIANLKRIDEAEAEKYELDEPQRYIEFQITKNNYAPLLPKSIFFKFEDGGYLTQVDIEAHRLKSIAETLKEVLLETNDQLSADEICNRNSGKEIRGKIKDECEGKVSTKNLKDAIKYGFENKIFTQETICIGTKRKPKAIIRPI